MIVRTRFQKFRLVEAFLSRIWHPIDISQFEGADSEFGGCQAVFSILRLQNGRKQDGRRFIIK